MSSTMPASSSRTHEKSFRTDSHPVDGVGLPVRTVSQPLRISAKSAYLADINEARTRLHMSVETMAINAECPVSQMSDALAGKPGRNFAGHWIAAQGPAFEEMFDRVRKERRGALEDAEDRRVRLARIRELTGLLIEEAAAS